MLSFVNEFGSGTPVALNFANLGVFKPGSAEHDPEMILQIGKDIVFCQNQGIQVMLSMGGAVGRYGFSSAADAESVALEFHNKFGRGSGDVRPFGDAIVDGYDLDIESASSYYENFVAKTKDLDPGMLISAAPQCVFPDAALGTVMNKAWLDYVSIQFYNTPSCDPMFSADDSGWTMKQYAGWAAETSINKNVRLFLGVIGCTTCGSTPYLGFDHLREYIDKSHIIAGDSFGGVMEWSIDAAAFNTNPKNSSENYVDFIKTQLDEAAAAYDPCAQHIQYRFISGSDGGWYATFNIDNAVGGITECQIRVSGSTTWTTVPFQDNHYVLNMQLKTPLSFRLTGAKDQVIEDIDVITTLSAGVVVTSQYQFGC